MKRLIAIFLCLLMPLTATAGGFRSFCGQRVLVQKNVVVQAVPTLVSPIYYVPQTPYRQASYSSQAEVQAKQDARDAKLIALAVAEALKQIGGPEARAQVAAALLVRRLLDDRLRGAVLVDASFEWRTPQIEPAATTMARTADRAPIEPFSEAAAAATTTTLLR